MTLIDPRPAIQDILTDDPAVAALIGNRVYPVILPQKPVIPAVTYSEISSIGDMHMRGPSGLMQSRFQFSVWGSTTSSVSQVASAVKSALNGFSGDKAYGSSSPQEVVTFRGVMFQNANDLYDSTAMLHYRTMDFTFWFAEF